MKGGDFTRSTFDKGRHFTKVNKQQGRVEMDADSNEQNDIVSHHERTFLRDIIGRSGTLKQDNGFKISGNFLFKWDSEYPGPKEAKALRTFLRDSFGLLWITEEDPPIHKSADGNTLTISAPDISHTATITRAATAGGVNPVLAIDGKPVYEFLQSGDDVWSRDYIIGKGDYYVDGILCENESDVEASRQPDILAEQQVRFLIFEWESAGEDRVKAAIAGFVSGMFRAMAGELLIVEESSPTLITITNPSTSATAEIELKRDEGKALLRRRSDTPDEEVELAAVKEARDKTLIYYQVENPSLASPHSPDIGVQYIACLDTCDQHVTHLEAPHIREKALGGVDTATRTRTAWQVRLLPFSSDNVNKCSIWDEVNNKLGMLDLGRMQARPKPTVEPTDMCKLYETAGYQGLENHLYRVEVHKGGSFAESTFKWSRDNGAVVSAVTKIHDLQNKIEIQSSGRDDNLNFKQDTWMEITSGLHDRLGLSGTLVKVREVKENTITYYPGKVIGLPITEGNFADNPKARRWDSDGVLKPANTTDYIELDKDGVEIRLGEGNYRTGDYWWVAARANSEESIEWPRIGDKLTDAPQALLPTGVAHHYAPLAVLVHEGDGKYSVNFDARSFFSSLADFLLIHYAGGDGQEATPGNNTLAEPLRVAVTVGGTSVGFEGAKVRFTIIASSTIAPSTPPSSSGTLTTTTEGSMTGSSSLEIDTNEEGIAQCFWTLGDSTQKQEVKAELVECRGDAKLPPIYFRATMSERGMSARSGELNLVIPAAPKGSPGKFPLIYGPFEHHLVGLRVPPALLLGLVRLDMSNEIKHTEDYPFWIIVEGDRPANYQYLRLELKPVDINLETFRVHLSLSKPAGIKLGETNSSSSAEFDFTRARIQTYMTSGSRLSTGDYTLDLDTHVLLRWWAIPAEEHPSVCETRPS